jgi:hypothetical protein
MVNNHVDIKLQKNVGIWQTEKITNSNMHEKKGGCKQQGNGYTITSQHNQPHECINYS